MPAKGNRLQCEDHGTTFGALEHCPQCPRGFEVLTDAGRLASLETPPTGCKNGAEHEKWFTEISEYSEEQAKKFSESTCRLEVGAAAKMIEVAIKARKAAALFTYTRERRAHVERLKQHRKQMRRGGRN